MNPSHFLILGGLCAAGTLGGYGIRRFASGGTSSSVAAESSAKSKPPGTRSVAEISTLPGIPHRKSEDTVETLLAADPQSLYARLAAWIIDATEEEIAAYWNGYKDGKRTSDITELVFIHWTRLNPRGAIAAVAGSEDEDHAWWAWAAHDPKGALAAVMAENPDRVCSVTNGISEFAPEWLRENFEKIPAAAREEALRSMAKWTNGEDPEGSLNFMVEHGMPFHNDTFLNLVRKDPWAAQDWLRRHPEATDNVVYGLSGRNPAIVVSPKENPQEQLFATLGRERPDELERMAAMTPPGPEKTKMEQALFDLLADSDPEAALKQARAAYPPILAAQHLGQLGMKLIHSDPDQAFALAAEMLKQCGGNLGFAKKIVLGEGALSHAEETGDNKSQRFLEMLNTMDRERTIELMANSAQQDNSLRQIFNSMTGQWADADLTGLTHWTNRQTDPDVRATSAKHISNKLLKQERFEEAMEWASVDPNYEKSLINILNPWAKKDREAAAAWLETANLPENEKATYRENLKKINP